MDFLNEENIITESELEMINGGGFWHNLGYEIEHHHVIDRIKVDGGELIHGLIDGIDA